MYVVRSLVNTVLSLPWTNYLNFLFQAISPLKSCPSSAPVSASVSSAMVSSPSSDVHKCLDNLQDEWSTCFARIEALLTIKSKTDAILSPVKAPVFKVKSPVASVSKTPFFYPSVSGRSGPDQVPEGQQDFQMKSPLANLYREASFETEPLFSSTSSAPAGSASRPEVDDREDISEAELVTGSDTELRLDQDNIQTEDQSYRETVRGVRSYMGWDFIPDLESSATSSSDNPWAGGRPHPMGKVSVAFPAEEWLCKKFELYHPIWISFKVNGSWRFSI